MVKTSDIKPSSALMRILQKPYIIPIRGVWNLAHMGLMVGSLVGHTTSVEQVLVLWCHMQVTIHCMSQCLRALLRPSGSVGLKSMGPHCADGCISLVLNPEAMKLLLGLVWLQWDLPGL